MPPRIDPRYPRIAALAGLVLTLALVWVGYAWVLRYLAAGDEADLAARMASDVIVYEDHVTRVLDTVSGRLRAAAALGAEAVERAPEPAPSAAAARSRPDTVSSTRVTWSS